MTTVADFYNATVDLIDRHPAEGRGDHVAIIDRSGSTTYSELAGLVNRGGNALAALGVRQEDRVALALLDTTAFPTMFWGAIKIGAIPVCLNTLLTTETYDYITNDCRARVLIVSEELLPQFTPLLADHPFIEQVVVCPAVDGAGDGFPRLSDLLADVSSELEPAATTADEVAFWLYSSGSTGMPKGVQHIQSALRDTATLYGEGVLGITSDDVVYSAAKLFFAYGLGNAMTFPFAAGATVVLLDGRPTPEAVSALMSEHQPTVFCGVPTLYAAMLADADFGPATSSSRLRRCISAGEALPESIGTTWKDRFGVDILDGIGSTEMLHIFVSNRPDDVRYGWSGKPVGGYEARVVDEDDVEVAPGELGELLVKGPSSAAAYWNQREKTQRTFVGKWTRTGDKYVQDADGYLQYSGRTDDMFKSGGNWVSPFEVESALTSHDAVLEAAVVPHADESGNLKPRAFVIPAAGVSGSDELVVALQEHTKATLELWKYPRSIVFVDELPKTATGKTQRYKLRDGV